MNGSSELYLWKCRRCGKEQEHNAYVLNCRCDCGYWMEWRKLETLEKSNNG